MTDDPKDPPFQSPEVHRNGLSTDGLGSGGSATDTGGLDADGNELGAVRPGSSEGQTEADRLTDAHRGPRPQ